MATPSVPPPERDNPNHSFPFAVATEVDGHPNEVFEGLSPLGDDGAVTRAGHWPIEQEVQKGDPSISPPPTLTSSSLVWEPSTSPGCPATAAALDKQPPQAERQGGTLHICAALAVVAAASGGDGGRKDDVLRTLEQWCNSCGAGDAAITVSKEHRNQVAERVQQLTDSRQKPNKSTKKAPPIKPADEYLWSCQMQTPGLGDVEGGWKKRNCSWESFEKKFKESFEREQSKKGSKANTTIRLVAKSNLRDLLSEILLSEKPQDRQVRDLICKLAPGVGVAHGAVKLILPRHPHAVLLSAASRPLDEISPGGAATRPAGSTSQDQGWANSVNERLKKLESKVEALQKDHVAPQDELRDKNEKRRRLADLAYWMPLSPGLKSKDFTTKGEVVAIVESDEAQTQEVRKLNTELKDKEWFPAVISMDYYHAANEQPSGQPAVTVCMIGFVPVTVAQDATVEVNDEICVSLSDGVSIQARSGKSNSDGVFTVGRALEGSQAAGPFGPRCFVRWQAEAVRGDSVQKKLEKELCMYEEHVQKELDELKARVDKLEASRVDHGAQLTDHGARLTALEVAIKGGHSPRPITTRKNFIGRRAELDALQTEFFKPGQAIVVIWGRAGLGKTTLMRECREEIKANYAQVVEVDGCGNIKSVKLTVASYAKQLKIQMKAELSVDNQLQAIKAKLSGQRCLFLVDNIDDPSTIEFWRSFLSNSSELWHVLATTRIQAIVLGMKELPGASDLVELQPLEDDERLRMVRGDIPCPDTSDETAAKQLASRTGPFQGTTLCLVPCGKLVKLKLASPREILQRVLKDGPLKAVETLKEQNKITGAPLDEVDRFMSIFDISFEYVNRMLRHDNPDFVHAAELASAIVKTCAVYSSAPLGRIVLLRAAFYMAKRRDWYTCCQPGRPPTIISDVPFNESDFDPAMRLLNTLGLCELVKTDGNDIDPTQLQFHSLQRDLAHRRFLANGADEAEAAHIHKSCRVALSSLQDLELPSHASKLNILPHIEATFSMESPSSQRVVDVEFGRAVVLRGKVRYAITQDIRTTVHDCVGFLQVDDMDRFSQAIILGGLSYFLRRCNFLYTSVCGWLDELYVLRYQPDTAKARCDSEAFHLAQRACLMMTETKTVAETLAGWTTDEDPLGVKPFTAWLKDNAERIVEHLDDISVIDFTNTIGSAVEYVRKSMGPKEAVELRKTGVYDLRVSRLGETHTSSVSTRYHLARIQSDAGDHQAAQESYEHVLNVLERIYGDKMCGHYLTCRTFTALAELPTMDPKSIVLLNSRIEKALGKMMQDTSAGSVVDDAPTNDEKSFWAIRKCDSHARTKVATFNCLHKDWEGKLQLVANGHFTRVDKDGGKWEIIWNDGNGELTLAWDKWKSERLVTTDGGRNFSCRDYCFKCEWLHVQTLPNPVTVRHPEGQILKTRRDHARVLVKAGNTHRALHVSNEIIKELDKQGRLSKQQRCVQADLLFISGQIYEQLGDARNCILQLERAITCWDSSERTMKTLNYLKTLDLLAKSYWLDGQRQRAVQTYTEVACALRDKAEGDHAAQVWIRQRTGKRTAKDWLLSVETCLATLQSEIQARLFCWAVGSMALVVAIAAASNKRVQKMLL
eukprot:SAG31_NODE_1890_length_6983_cov_7.615485_2_plen_1606_part_00